MARPKLKNKRRCYVTITDPRTKKSVFTKLPCPRDEALAHIENIFAPPQPRVAAPVQLEPEPVAAHETLSPIQAMATG